MRPTNTTLLQRFWSKVRVETGPLDTPCWAWAAAINDNGYARFWDKDRTVNAHAWAYRQFVGAVPAGLQLDHLCENRWCVNPHHLEPVTQRENLLRSPRTLASAHRDRRDCGFPACKNCRRFRVGEESA